MDCFPTGKKEGSLCCQTFQTSSKGQRNPKNRVVLIADSHQACQKDYSSTASICLPSLSLVNALYSEEVNPAGDVQFGYCKVRMQIAKTTGYSENPQ